MRTWFAVLMIAGLSSVSVVADDFEPLPPPEWLKSCEVYVFGWPYPADPHDITEEMWKEAGCVPLRPHVPHIEELFRAGSARGLLMLPYTTVYRHRWEEHRGGLYTHNIPHFELKDHPEWTVFNADGTHKHSCFYDEETSHEMEMCPNCPEYVEVCLEHFRMLLEMGAGGFFIDNTPGSPECYGERLGKHQHIFPGIDRQREALRDLMQRVQKLCRQYNPNFVTMLNCGAGPACRYLAPACDLIMWEQYIIPWNEQLRMSTWEQVRPMAEKWRPLSEQGHYLAPYSYVRVGTDYGLKNDCFYTYTAARLSDFIWSGGAASGSDPRAVLYRTRLGKPLGWMFQRSGVWVRLFERGFVALNDSGEVPLQLYRAWGTAPKTSFRKLVPLAAVSDDAEPELQFYSMNRRGDFTVTITVNGNVVKAYKPEDLRAAAEIGYAWRKVPLDRSIVAESNEVVFTIEGQPDEHCNFWLRVDMARNEGHSSYAPDGENFVSDDLSPIKDKQPGEYMVRIVGKGVQQVPGEDPTTRGQTRTLRLRWLPEWKSLQDVYSGEMLEPVEGSVVKVTIPPQSGRVYAMP